MNRNEILRRIEELRNAIAYSRCEGRIMSVSQGMCCNQEIAAWYKVLQRIELGASETGEAHYTIPAHLESKVDQITRITKQINWVKPSIY